jgi:TatD DNase family protein
MSEPSSHGWTDHHCHLPSIEEGRVLVEEAGRAGVDRLVTVGTSLGESRRAIEVANALDDVWATAGVHPHDAIDGIDGIEALLDEPDVVAVGECGLDYHYMHSPIDDQRRVFAAQIALAAAHGLPLVIHTRDAWDDTFDILAAEGVPERLVFHCFTGGPDEARRCLDLDAHLSFSGIVTFPSASELRDAARLCPDDRLLVETDSPYLAPVPHRGRPNRPALVSVVGEAVARERGAEPTELARITSANASALYAFDVDGGDEPR